MEDLTKGSIIKGILRFAWPIFVGNLVFQIYSIVNMFLVANIAGNEIFSAICASGWLYGLIINFLSSLVVGFSIETSHQYGAKNQEKIKKSFAMSILLTLTITVILLILALTTVKPLLKLLNTPTSILPYATSYLIVLFSGLLITAFNTLIVSMLRALGNSKVPLIILIISVGLNLGLDTLFITLFHFGVISLAIASLSAALLSFLIAIIYMLKKYPYLKLSFKDFKPDRSMIFKETLLGLPMAIHAVLISIGGMFVQKALNSLGSEYILAVGIAGRIDSMLTIGLFALGGALAIYIGHNYGANDFKRIKEAVKTSFIIGLVIATICSLLLAFGGIYLVYALNLIQGDPSSILGYIKLYFYITSGGYIFLMFILVYRNSLQGIDAIWLVLISGGIELVSRTVMSLLPYGFVSVVLNNPVCWLLTGTFVMIAWFIKYKQKKIA